MRNKTLEKPITLILPETSEKATVPVAVAARRLGRTTSTVRRLIDEGELRGVRIFGRWEVAEADIRKIEQQRADLA